MAVGILVGVAKKPTVGADKAEKLTVASGKVENVVAIQMGSPAHQGSSGSVGKAVWMLVGVAEVGCNWPRS